MLSTDADRPLSPHLSIYQPQLTWLMSIGHRMTGAGLSTGLYAAGVACAFGSLSAFGAPPVSSLYTESVLLAGGVGPIVGFVAKWLVAAPFAFHCLNGVRHLVWDAGLALSLKGVYAGGWVVTVGSVLAGSLLALL